MWAQKKGHRVLTKRCYLRACVVKSAHIRPARFNRVIETSSNFNSSSFGTDDWKACFDQEITAALLALSQHDRAGVKPLNDCMYLDEPHSLAREMHTTRFTLDSHLRCMYAMCLGGIFVADQAVQRALEKQHTSNQFRVFKNLVLSRKLPQPGIRIREELSC
jgi:hypothetical protein